MFPVNFLKIVVLLSCLILFSILSCFSVVYAEDEKVLAKEVVDGTDTSANSNTPLADLFTGSMSYRIPIEIPAGRRGVEPGIVLTYKSTNGNSWLGVGWELEMGSIERSTKKGVNYTGSEFIMRGPGGVTELVETSAAGVSPREFRAKIEGAFIRYIFNGTYWEAVNKRGVRFRFGYSSANRQTLDANNTFKWCLDRITDKNGNYISITYTKDNGQIYPQQIDYTGSDNSTSPLPTSNRVIFNLEDRSDAPTLYVTNFAVKTAKRLKSIEIRSNTDTTTSNLVRKYELNYDAGATTNGNQYSPVTGRSVLASVTEYGSDGVTAKPPIILHYSNDYSRPSGLPNDSWLTLPSSFMSMTLPVSNQCMFGRFRMDTEIACSTGSNGWDLKFFLNSGSLQWTNGTSPAALSRPFGQQCIAGDYKKNGLTGFACNISNNGEWVMAFPSPSNSLEWSTETWQNGPKPGVPINQCYAGDFDGNGTADFVCHANNTLQMALSTGSSFGNNPVTWTGIPSTYFGQSVYCLTGDYSGDGKTDFACNFGNGSGWSVFISDGTKWTAPLWGNGANVPYLATYSINRYCLTGDYNGDGKTDIACYNPSVIKWYVALSTGSGWDTTSFPAGGPAATVPVYDKCTVSDFNNDGKSDIACHTAGSDWSMMLSTGKGWLLSESGGSITWGSGVNPSTSVNKQCFTGYADKTGNIICYTGSSNNWEYSLPYTPITDLLTRVSNGLGGEINVTYSLDPWVDNPYSRRFPFLMQLVAAISVSDGNGNTATSNYFYDGGFYHIGEKDFRGFNYAKVINPSSPDGMQTVTETWFHQGDDVAVGFNNPSVPTGYMKGKPYRTTTSIPSLWGGYEVVSQTDTTYTLKNAGTNYYAPPTQVDSYFYEGGYRQTRAVYDYDAYGNITLEERYGDVGSGANKLLNMTIVRSFSPNETGTNWLVGFPSSETVYRGIGTAESDKISKTNYYYDNYTDCASVPTTASSQTPDKGNLTRVSRWLNSIPESYVETTTAYDLYGNPKCSRDPNGNVSATAFDGTYQTFPASITNAKGHSTSYSYYGVGIAADKGRYGQLKSITDPNSAVTSFEYDAFGRKTKESQPDGFWTQTSYSLLGTVGSQHISTGNQLGMSSDSYFDGLGRTFKVRRSGPDGKFIIAETAYDGRGQVSRVSLPYFEGLETALYRTYIYDVLGRVTQTTNPDSTTTMACYNDLITVRIDENGHRRRETKDPLGRLVTVDDYAGNYTSCDVTQAVTPYATTNYAYDVLGNLTDVIDANQAGVATADQKTTHIEYDTLGRKQWISDPDMGRWDYDYYPDGTLKSTKDANHQANGQLISYGIDELNRVATKTYPADASMGTVTYTYDETTSTNAKGRLTKMSDGSGYTVYNYDKPGRPTRTVKRIDSTDYTITKAWDGLGRLSSIIYPDNENITYRYDLGGNLSEVSGYAEYGEYNALGQPGKLYHGNGIVTSYWYYPKNYRLFAMKTDQLQTSLLYKTYSYDKKGNLTRIDDLASAAMAHNIPNPSVGYTYWPSHANRLQTASTSPGRTYLYDDNGNITSDGIRTITYTPDNMPKTVTGGGSTASFTYDGNNKRVKKAGNLNRIYIGKLHECTTTCVNYIYAGNTRIAASLATGTEFYHPDHLGSTAVTTDQNGNRLEDIAYYPFGETRHDSLVEGVKHKYTGQELDYETGDVITNQIAAYYNYDARLYDPEIGRFITPDSIIPDYSNPQYLNRYAYALNNPLKYIDSTGHFAQVRVDGNRVNITVPIIYSGNAASPSNISALNNSIQRTWSGTFGSYNVTTTVVDGAKFIENAAKNYGVAGAMSNYIELKQGTGTSFVSEGTTGTWYQPGQGKAEWEAAHEAGHLMGLPDQYVATFDSNGNRTGTQARSGFENNIMGSYGQTNVTGQDINNVIPWTSQVANFFSNLFSPAPEPSSNVSSGSYSGSVGDNSGGYTGSTGSSGGSGSSGSGSLWSFIFGD